MRQHPNPLTACTFHVDASMPPVLSGDIAVSDTSYAAVPYACPQERARARARVRVGVMSERERENVKIKRERERDTINNVDQRGRLAKYAALARVKANIPHPSDNGAFQSSALNLHPASQSETLKTLNP